MIIKVCRWISKKGKNLLPTLQYSLVYKSVFSKTLTNTNHNNNNNNNKSSMLNNTQESIQIFSLIWWINLLLKIIKKCKPIKELKQEVGDGLSVGVLNILPKVSSLPRLLATSLNERRDMFMWPHDGHLIKGSCLGASYTKLTPSLMWYRYILCN